MADRRYAVVVNPHGGRRRGLRVLEGVTDVFRNKGATLDVYTTSQAGDAADLAQSIDLTDCEALCVIGGDGTLHETISGLMRREQPDKVPLGIIPGGTGNSVSEHLQIREPLDAARRIIHGKTQRLDVTRVTMADDIVHCVNIIGWGAAVDINRTAERLRWLGPPRYSLSAMAHILRARRRRARVVLDDQILEDEFMLIVACNTKYTGKGMLLAPNAETDDGRIDVVLVRQATRIQMLQLFHRVFDGSHVTLPCVEFHQVQRLEIEADEPGGRLNLDGELKGRTPVTAQVIPSALRIFV